MSFKVNLVGYDPTTTVAGGELSPAIFPDTYATPYPIKFAGLLLKSALSTAYDAAATPTYPVAIPAGLGGLPDIGAAFTTTARTDLTGSRELFAGVDYYKPVVSVRTGGSSEYAQLEANFAEVTGMPLVTGRVIGVPVRAATNIIVGDEITSDASGFATIAVSTNWVVGRAETPANNAAGAAGAMYVWVKVGPIYKKA